MSVLTNRVGLSINEDCIQLVEIIINDNNYRLYNIEEEYFEETLSQKTKEAKYIHILQNAFNEVVLRKSLEGKIISVSLPPSVFKVFEIPADKNLTKTDLNDYIHWELSKLFPTYSKDYFTFQKVVLNPLSFESFKRVLVFAIPLHLLKTIHKFSSRNNFKLKYVDHAHIAAIVFLMDQQSESSQLSLHIGNRFLSFLLMANKGIIYESSTYYNSINEISQNVKQFLEELKNKNFDTSGISTANIFGNNITSELNSSVENSTGVKFIKVNPFSKLEISEPLSKNKFITENPFKFASATAMALRI